MINYFFFLIGFAVGVVFVGAAYTLVLHNSAHMNNTTAAIAAIHFEAVAPKRAGHITIIKITIAITMLIHL